MKNVRTQIVTALAHHNLLSDMEERRFRSEFAASIGSADAPANSDGVKLDGFLPEEVDDGSADPRTSTSTFIPIEQVGDGTTEDSVIDDLDAKRALEADAAKKTAGKPSNGKKPDSLEVTLIGTHNIAKLAISSYEKMRRDPKAVVSVRIGEKLPNGVDFSDDVIIAPHHGRRILMPTAIPAKRDLIESLPLASGMRRAK